MPSHFEQFDLLALARREMEEAGFDPGFSYGVEQQLRRIAEQGSSFLSTLRLTDLRAPLWSSVDNEESRDLDQIEVAERLPNGNIRLRIGIADVDAFVPKNSAIDHRAGNNGTSVYTGVTVFPMLPDELSEGVTSLLPDEDRAAVVVEMEVNEAGEVVSSGVTRALVRNHAKLVYESVGDWLDGEGGPPEAIARVPGLPEQVSLQNEAAERLQAHRKRSGSLDLETVEARPVVEDGKVVDLTVLRRNRARLLIENLMVAANTVVTEFLASKGFPAIQRVVREPERWPRIVELAQRLGQPLPDHPDSKALSDFLDRQRIKDPDHFPDLSLSMVKLLGPGEYLLVRDSRDLHGHFGMAAQNYSHSTAPNRRYPDLVMQRLIKAALAGQPSPYTDEELESIAQKCTAREDAARKIERTLRKAMAAVLMSDRIGDVFSGIVTGVTPKGTFVRVIAPPVEGRVMRGEHGMDVGDRVHVRLLATDPEKGFIDFARS